MKCSEIKVIKKDGTKEEFNVQKVLAAVNKSANRAMIIFSKAESKFICEFVEEKAEELDQSEVPIAQMHNIVEGALERVNPVVAKSYRDYRNYKQDFVQMLDEVYKKSQSIMYIGDKENSNTDSALVSTKRSLIFNELNKSLYQKFFMTVEELQACRDGYIYIHDMSARRDTMNCCLFDVNEVLSGGFEMGNIWYNEPKTLDVAFDVIGDIVLSAASQQYGGLRCRTWRISWRLTRRNLTESISQSILTLASMRRRQKKWHGTTFSARWNRDSRDGSTSLTLFPPAAVTTRLSP